MKIIPGATLWQLKATHGLPLDMIMLKCAKEGFVPEWLGLLNAALKDGANMKTLCNELRFDIKEAYDAQLQHQVLGDLVMACAEQSSNKISI